MYNDTVLVDANLNRISCISFDYYISSTNAMWAGYVYNDTTTNISDCKITTISGYDGVFSISGGGVTGYRAVTSNWGTTCSIGAINSSGIVPILLNMCITGGISGFQAVPLYISK